METTRRGFLDAFQLKVLMAALMVLDHLYYNLFPQLYGAHVAARVVAPVFCYLVTEGMRYTRNRRRYILRMLLFGGVMLAGNALLYALYGRWIDNSILLSLAITAAVIACADRARGAAFPAKLLWALAVAGLFVVSFWVEGGYMLPLMGVLFYFMRDRPVFMWIVFFLALCTPFLGMWATTGELQAQFWMILAVIPIRCYNGRRGRNDRFAKYFFYVFYPLHIWIIFLLEQALL